MRRIESVADRPRSVYCLMNVLVALTHMTLNLIIPSHSRTTIASSVVTFICQQRVCYAHLLCITLSREPFSCSMSSARLINRSRLTSFGASHSWYLILPLSSVTPSLFTARRYPSAVYAVVVCPHVCLEQADIVSKLLTLQHSQTPSFPRRRRQMQVG